MSCLLDTHAWIWWIDGNPRLPSSFHRDPADRIIEATARALDLPVLTWDKKIRESGLVRLWDM